MNRSTVNPHHISQFFKIPAEVDLDFFDANLVYDSPVFIDPFLIKNSIDPEQVKLFDRFGDYFRFAYDKSLELSVGQLSERELRKILTVHEPKNISMGYTESSNEGHGPSLSTKLMGYFIDNAARKFVKETDAFPGNRYNPISIQLFTEGIGPDGISDITANLIMDYLISYTQNQADKLNIPMKRLALDIDGFDFETMSWRNGGYYLLPENPIRTGEPLIFVPRYLLRGFEDKKDNAASKVMSILKADEDLAKRFSSFIEKKISEIKIDDIRAVFMKEKSVHFKYLQRLEAEHSKPYDFKGDPLNIFIDKDYEDHFQEIKLPKLEDGNDLKNYVDILIHEFNIEFSKKDGWKDAWRVGKTSIATPQTEPVIGRKFRAMGAALFSLIPEATFTAESGTGNGFLDFQVVYKDTRIAIELKLLKNNAPKGPEKLPAYIQGLKTQLPEYATLLKANYAYYITGQHYDGTDLNAKYNHSDRVQALERIRPDIETGLRKSIKNFKNLTYINVNMSKRPSASKA